MSSATGRDWRPEFGLGSGERRAFFASKAELRATGSGASQGNVARRAFDLLELDGVLCADNTPLVYFKETKHIEAAEVARLHRKLWNHGGAPILVIVAPDQVHVYSGLLRPQPQADPSGALVETLDRASAAIAAFLPAVESGEFFRSHAKSFDPAHRVDRDLLDNLQATRDKLVATSTGRHDTNVLDALLCRLVFACYLFDRGVVGETYLRDIGLAGAQHLRDVLGMQPRTEAKRYLYDLFRKLGHDFNGDLFSDDLDAEADLVSPSYIDPLDDFFGATDVVTGQGSFWPYDFAAIPIEAISAIYERFLKGSEKLRGAFYTPRLLAELVLDMALTTTPSLLDQRYLDPACGSGIFLVGLFNRMAEEWMQANPDATNDHRAQEMRKMLCGNLCGVDIDPTACRITAFSLYLAYLDQLSPRDIRELQQKGQKLPRLVHQADGAVGGEMVEGSIWCGDFFAEDATYPVDVDQVIGNPPWGSTALKDTPAAVWCSNPDHQYPIPDKQISAAFVWKAAHHVVDSGKICLVLPHGTLFNHSTTAVGFQQTLFSLHAVDRVLNLADYQRFLFEEAGHPALVVTYRKTGPKGPQHTIEYWAPKADWLVMRAEVITVQPEDRCTVTVGQVLADLGGKDAPQIWKQRYWATARDRRLVDRLSLYPRLRDHVRQLKEKGTNKPWLMAVGVQPVGESDDPRKAETVLLPSRLFREAASSNPGLFLLPEDCKELPSPEFTARSGSNKDTTVFRAPHLLIAKGFTSVAFADFDVSFQDSVRGIHGPRQDRDLLIFLAAYLRSSLARYFLFHTSSNWGIARQEVHVQELLRLPFVLPDDLPDPRRSWEIVREVAGIVSATSARAGEGSAPREELVRIAGGSIEPLLDEYFDVMPLERVLVDDTLQVIVPSIRPTRRRMNVPTIEPSTRKQWDDYTTRLCDTLNGWAKSGPSTVQGRATASAELGVGVVVLQKTRSGEAPPVAPPADLNAVLPALDRLREVTSQKLNTLELIRGVKIFDRDHLYLVKPISYRFWTKTAALNDADEIAGTILMHTHQGVP